MNGDTGSAHSWSLVKKWVNTCSRSHPKCKKLEGQSRLPSRVIDLKASCASGIALYESKRQHAEYACLSHCWGSSQPLQTTRASIARFRTEISKEDLPKTFLDAISIAKRLDFHYLWIDSLCIIQDDRDDWAREASVMARTYQQASICIAATRSFDADSGVFHRNDDACDEELSTFTRNPDHDGIFLVWDEGESTSKHRRHHGFNNPPTHELPNLLTRGWALQEWVLSPRILHFNYEIIFECMESVKCECLHPENCIWPMQLQIKNLCNEYILMHEDSWGIYMKWRAIIDQYSVMHLTFDSDVLPAISGMARLFQRYIRGRYIAGLWERFLVHELTWVVEQPQLAVRRIPWVAPSFSWASINVSHSIRKDVTGFDSTLFQLHLHRHLRWVELNLTAPIDCEIIEVSTTLAGPSETGQVANDHVLLKGLVYVISSEDINILSWINWIEGAPHYKYEKQTFYPDFDYSNAEKGRQGTSLGTHLYCLLLQQFESSSQLEGETSCKKKYWACFLVLKRLGSCDSIGGIFERVGLLVYEVDTDVDVARRGFGGGKWESKRLIVKII